MDLSVASSVATQVTLCVALVLLIPIGIYLRSTKDDRDLFYLSSAKLKSVLSIYDRLTQFDLSNPDLRELKDISCEAEKLMNQSKILLTDNIAYHEFINIAEDIQTSIEFETGTDLYELRRRLLSNWLMLFELIMYKTTFYGVLNKTLQGNGSELTVPLLNLLRSCNYRALCDESDEPIKNKLDNQIKDQIAQLSRLSLLVSNSYCNELFESIHELKTADFRNCERITLDAIGQMIECNIVAFINPSYRGQQQAVIS